MKRFKASATLTIEADSIEQASERAGWLAGAIDGGFQAYGLELVSKVEELPPEPPLERCPGGCGEVRHDGEPCRGESGVRR